MWRETKASGSGVSYIDHSEGPPIAVVRLPLPKGAWLLLAEAWAARDDYTHPADEIQQGRANCGHVAPQTVLPFVQSMSFKVRDATHAIVSLPKPAAVELRCRGTNIIMRARLAAIRGARVTKLVMK